MTVESVGLTFGQPAWLLAGIAAIVILILLARFSARRRREALGALVSAHLLDALTAGVSARGRAARVALLAAGLAGCFTALARPELGYHWEEERRRGIDVLFAVDVSRSMLAQDARPNRLERAKLAITDLVGRLENDRVGLIAFAGTAFLQEPLTLDHDAFLESLQALDPSVIPKGGTDLASALREAARSFATEQRNEKRLIVLTDGEDLEGGALAAAGEVAKEGVRVYTVGVGTAAGDLIPVPDAQGGTSFVRDPSGQFVKSHLDEAGLREVAEATGGFYEPLGAQGEGLVAVWHRGLESMAKTELAGRLRRVPHERFQWPLAFGILCLLIEMLVREGTRRSAVRAAAAAALLALVIPPSAIASPQSAARAWEAGDWARAAAEWRDAATHDPSDLRLRFNEGAAAYRAGDLPAATAAFGKALETEHVPLQQQAYYNLGNAQFRLGERSSQTNPQETVGAWQAALKAYDGALRLDPADDDARFNRDLVQKKLEELQRRMEQQKQEQQKQEEQKDQAQKDQQQQQQQEQGQQQQNQQQAGQPQEPEQQTTDEAQAKSQGGNPRPEEKPQQTGQQPTPSEGGDKKPQGDAAAKAAAREMTPEEARALLDSLRGDVRAVPLGKDARPTPDDAGRDW